MASSLGNFKDKSASFAAAFPAPWAWVKSLPEVDFTTLFTTILFRFVPLLLFGIFIVSLPVELVVIGGGVFLP